MDENNTFQLIFFFYLLYTFPNTIYPFTLRVTITRTRVTTNTKYCIFRSTRILSIILPLHHPILALLQGAYRLKKHGDNAESH